MPPHPSPDDLRRYARGEAPAQELLALDDHVSECELCRAELSLNPALAKWAAGLDAEQAPDSHLSHQQLAAYVDKRQVPGRLAVEAHLETCAMCREEAADLNRFRQSLPQPKRPSAARWMVPAAAAALLALGIWIWQKPAAEKQARLEIPATWAAPERDLFANTLAAGTLPFAPPPSDVASSTGALLGASTPDAFKPLSPLGVVTFSDRPAFEWQPLAGASSYKVEVYGADFARVAQSPSLPAASWTPEAPLERGKLYRWEVTASVGSKSIAVPAPPAPEARFRILDAAAAAHIERARASGDPGHVLAAILFAQSGMRADALKELESVRHYPAVEQLIGSLH